MVLLFLLVLVVLATMVIGDSNLTCVLGGSIVFFYCSGVRGGVVIAVMELVLLGFYCWLWF